MSRMLSAALAAAFLTVAAPSVADAQSPRERHELRELRQQTEASMLVTGHVDIDREGRVTAMDLDQSDKLPQYVVGLLENAAPSLRFEPILVDGAPVLARAKMSVRMVASPGEAGDIHLRIASAHFGDTYSDDDRTSLRRSDLRPPQYPADAAKVGGKGTVYLLVKVGRDGKPQDVMAEQVNLTAVGNARQMESIRNILSETAISNALRYWSFTPPEIGEGVARDYWVVRVPVQFSLYGDKDPVYGQWSAYHPGERTTPAWAGPTQPGFSPDTLVAGGITPSTSRFRLVTPFEG